MTTLRDLARDIADDFHLTDPATWRLTAAVGLFLFVAGGSFAAGAYALTVGVTP